VWERPEVATVPGSASMGGRKVGHCINSRCTKERKIPTNLLGEPWQSPKPYSKDTLGKETICARRKGGFIRKKKKQNNKKEKEEATGGEKRFPENGEICTRKLGNLRGKERRGGGVRKKKRGGGGSFKQPKNNHRVRSQKKPPKGKGVGGTRETNCKRKNVVGNGGEGFFLAQHGR